MAKSLLHMISNDIGQLACLYAKLHNLSRVYFGGFFIRGHPVTMHTITYSINFFTKFDMLEMDRLERQLVNLPLLQDPSSYIPDTVDLIEDAQAREYWLYCFEEALDGIKERENDIALKYYQKAVKSLEELSWEDRQFALVRGVLAGNVFDWGAKAVSECGPPHRCALFFVDNSGVDIILGVMPFVRELLSRGTEVNHKNRNAKCVSLWLFSRLDKVLAMVVRERQTDLVIVEGMGRAIHTNYYAMLSCESLKMAVIKNSWLADRLGGKLFSVVFKYEVPAGKPH
ncbi:hypothetical protein XENOCAPTIV_017108 [Xenoophorus captivus]|uniref:4'-phosphopantetheine phosphatase n=1 Tax=Xenoophorus captivus TaxID=1517983 RepID=A0ABV0QM38_9TELE